MSVRLAPAGAMASWLAAALAVVLVAAALPVVRGVSAAAAAPATVPSADDDDVLAAYLHAAAVASPRAADVADVAAAAAAAAADAADRSGGSLAVWEPAQPDPRWYLLTEAEAAQAQDSALNRVREGRERLRESRVSSHRAGSAAAASPPYAVPADAADEEGRRRPTEHKRAGPSLSIVNPLDVLRQRILLEIARRRIKQSEGQIQANRDLLRVIGKRARWQ